MDELSPFQSPNTRLVSAALACGLPYGDAEANFKDEVEELPDGQLKRTVRWVMDGDKKVPFIWAEEDEHGNLKAKKEMLTFKEFRDRYIDLDWVRSNPDHPISYLRGTHFHHTRMLKQIKEQPQHSIIRRGRRTASIPDNATEEERKKALKFIGG